MVVDLGGVSRCIVRDEDLEAFVGGIRFVEVIVHQADGSGAAGGEAFGEFDRPCAAGGNGDGMVVAHAAINPVSSQSSSISSMSRPWRRKGCGRRGSEVCREPFGGSRDRR